MIFFTDLLVTLLVGTDLFDSITISYAGTFYSKDCPLGGNKALKTSPNCDICKLPFVS